MIFERRQGNPSKHLGNELKYLKKVLAAESWSATGGSWANKLESEFAELHSTKYAIAMNSGTATLHASLNALGVRPGDEVITPALTVIMDSTSIFHSSAIPVYVDVDSKTFNIDPKKIEKAITPKTKAIIAVSLYGLPCEFNEILNIARRYNIPVIEDNAQCMLSTYDSKIVGSFGNIASWSFETTKHISCGEGGIVTTNDENLAEALRKFGGHGFKNLKASEGRIRLNQEVFQDPNYKRHDRLGWNYRLPEFNAAVALAQLERVKELVDLRIGSANLFLEELGSTNMFITQNVPSNAVHSYYTLAVRYIGHELYGVTWQEFRKKYIANGGDGIYGAWSVPYLEPLISSSEYKRINPDIYSKIEYRSGLCPVAESIQPQIMQFKTNYRDLRLAKNKARALGRTVGEIEKK